MTDPEVSSGARLKAERERRGLSAQKAADELHLDGWVIDALEAGDYTRIGPTVYARGHLKRYAGLLGLPAAELLEGFQSKAQAPPTGPVAVRTTPFDLSDETRVSGNLSAGQTLGGLAVLALIVGVVWWKPWHQRGRTPVISSPAAAAGSARSADVAIDAPEENAADTSRALLSPGSAPAAALPTSLSGAAPVGAGVSTKSDPPAGAGRARLRLSFSANSRVDVYDATGRQVYSGSGLANSVKSIAGAAPLRVYLGSGSGVQLEINDRAVAIGAQFFAGDVARFEAGADGVLRRDSHAVQSRNTRPPG